MSRWSDEARVAWLPFIVGVACVVGAVTHLNVGGSSALNGRIDAGHYFLFTSQRVFEEVSADVYDRARHDELIWLACSIGAVLSALAAGWLTRREAKRRALHDIRPRVRALR